ncbi:MAG TPA: TonB family protein [Bryobacteraceae bacterium]
MSGGVHAALTALLLAITIPAAREGLRGPVKQAVLIAPLPAYVAPPKLVMRNTPKPKPIPPEVKRIEPLLIPAPAVNRVIPNVVTKIEPPIRPAPDLPPQLPPADLAKRAPTPRPVLVGGFGDPNGVSSAIRPKPAPVLLANVGAFDSPKGSGQGGERGHNASGLVRESGFGAVGAASGHAAENGQVRTGAFADAIANPQSSRKTAEASAPAVTPVEILFKPKPVYTAEARSLRLEGQVSLEVVFLSTGSIRVIRVVHGLGHGLDEAAQQAALQVRFRPATRGGVAVDTNATINITFELT